MTQRLGECNDDIYDRFEEVDAHNTRLQRALDAAKRGNRRLWDENERLRAVLEKVEWVWEAQDDYYCPLCNAEKKGGHLSDCTLQAALSPAEQPAPRDVSGEGER